MKPESTGPYLRIEPAVSPSAHAAQLVSPEAYDYLLAGFRELLPVPQGTQPHLRGVIQETLEHPGSLVRAQLVFGLISAHDVSARLARAIAVAIEYFHTASLLFDDLPCMDDAQERRGHACPHRVFGEDAAVLGALAFITRGYSLLWQGLSTLSDRQMTDARILVDECLGVGGILNGQAHDLHFADSARGEQDVLRVALGKTATLIRLTLLLPAIVCDVPPEIRARLEQLAEAWGLSYQIMDDFKDSMLSSNDTGKTSARDQALDRPNLPNTIGGARAAAVLREKMTVAEAMVSELIAARPGWTLLGTLHQKLAMEGIPFGVQMPLRAAV